MSNESDIEIYNVLTDASTTIEIVEDRYISQEDGSYREYPYITYVMYVNHIKCCRWEISLSEERGWFSLSEAYQQYDIDQNVILSALEERDDIDTEALQYLSFSLSCGKDGRSWSRFPYHYY